jgi:hypothetical protein
MIATEFAFVPQRRPAMSKAEQRLHFTNSLSEASSIHRISPGEFLARIADLINKVSLVQVVC